jgi:hypothetical protein
MSGKETKMKRILIATLFVIFTGFASCATPLTLPTVDPIPRIVPLALLS